MDPRDSLSKLYERARVDVTRDAPTFAGLPSEPRAHTNALMQIARADLGTPPWASWWDRSEGDHISSGWSGTPAPLRALGDALRKEQAELGGRREPLGVASAPPVTEPEPRPVFIATPRRTSTPAPASVAPKADQTLRLVLAALATQPLPGEVRSAAADVLARAIDGEDWALAQRALEMVVTGIA